MANISVDEFPSPITEALMEYSQDVTDNLKIEIMDVAKECVKALKETSPKGVTKSYRKGWRAKKMYESTDDIRVSVHNKTDYQLTHLLEYGHAKTNGGRVEARPHIGAAEEMASERLMKKVKVIVK